MREQLLVGLWPPPAPGTRLGLTLAGLAIGALNLAFLAEIWPHTPAARPRLLALEWLLVLALVPQALWWAWRWRRAYAGPGWLRVLATAVFLSGAGATLFLWLAVLVGWVARKAVVEAALTELLADEKTVVWLTLLWWLLVLVMLFRLFWWGWRGRASLVSGWQQRLAAAACIAGVALGVISWLLMLAVWVAGLVCSL